MSKIILKKISEDHYVVVMDELPKQNDWYLGRTKDGFIYDQLDDVGKINDAFNSKKITASTQPLGIYCSGICDKIVHDYSDEATSCTGVCDNLWRGVKELSLNDVKSLVGDVGIEHKADKIWKEVTGGKLLSIRYEDWSCGFGTGYNERTEDFTKAIHEILNHLCDKMEIITQEMIDKDPFQLGRYRTFKYVFDYIKSVTEPKDSWEVEWDENGKLKLKSNV